jgi:hypothetical protein
LEIEKIGKLSPYSELDSTMYSTKTIHKNINPNYPQVYTSIGDPYKTTLEELPDRWKNKQFITQRHPQNAGDGFFTKLQYRAEPYTELCEQGYSKSQPLEERKLGFGSHDAFKRDEFTNTTATERYRDLLKSEKKLQSNRAASITSKLDIKSLTDRRPPEGLQEPRFLYDIGRSNVTPFNPRNAHDKWYNIPAFAPMDDKQGQDKSRRLGGHKPMSATIGERAWEYHYGKPSFGQVSFVSNFHDRGHLECKGF